VHACAWSEDGQHILSASLDKTLKIWDAATGTELGSLYGHREGMWPENVGVRCVAVAVVVVIVVVVVVVTATTVVVYSYYCV
jgi:WD40 repeat protein